MKRQLFSIIFFDIILGKFKDINAMNVRIQNHRILKKRGVQFNILAMNQGHWNSRDMPPMYIVYICLTLHYMGGRILRSNHHLNLVTWVPLIAQTKKFDLYIFLWNYLNSPCKVGLTIWLRGSPRKKTGYLVSLIKFVSPPTLPSIFSTHKLWTF